ncbi:MAG: CoA transferase [Acidimicrobiales bacterium]
MSEQTALLAGVRVVDLGDEATARAGALLAELGAEVVRVEDPAGDAVRTSPKGLVLHAVVNAGKRSVALRTDHDSAAGPAAGRRRRGDRPARHPAGGAAAARRA